MAKSYLDKDGLLYFLQKIRPSSTPLMDGTASTGTSKRFAAEDHVHPRDTTLAPKASPALTGTPTAPTAATGTSTTQIATTEFVANTVGAMTSGVADVQIDNTSIVTSGIAKIPTASTSAKGLMTSEDKSKLDGITYTGVSDVTVNGNSSVTNGVAAVNPHRLGFTYRTCSTASGTYAKVTSGSSTTFTLSAGSIVAVLFENACSYITTLNVLGTGAKYVKYRSTTATSSAPINTSIAADGVAYFMYDGTNYILLDWQHQSATTTRNGYMTTTQVEKLNGIATGAEVNVLEGVQVDGTDLAITSKKVNIPLASSSANGVMSSTDKSKLDSLTITNGVIDASNLPSYVDDVIEAYPRSGATALSASWLSATSGGAALTPETGKIYVLMADSGDYAANTQFRWGGSAYVKLSDGGVSSITNAEIDTIVAS